MESAKVPVELPPRGHHSQVPPTPSGMDAMSLLTQSDLDQAAHSLNGGLAQTLDGMSPSEKPAEVSP